jgi:hypothetical protein
MPTSPLSAPACASSKMHGRHGHTEAQASARDTGLEVADHVPEAVDLAPAR